MVSAHQSPEITASVTVGHLLWNPHSNQVQLCLAANMPFHKLSSYVTVVVNPTHPKSDIAERQQAGIHFDEAREQFWVDGLAVPLTYFSDLESRLLQYLCKNGGLTCSYYQLTQQVWFVGPVIIPSLKVSIGCARC
jgi:hypothetical protein